jgi:IMP dehydrogenase
MSFDDVLLVPQYSDIESRKSLTTSNELDDTTTLQLPIISSPMDTVTEVSPFSLATLTSRASPVG